MLDLPGRVPLPAKITVEVLPAIDLRAELGDDPDADAGYDPRHRANAGSAGRARRRAQVPLIG